ncbi:transmembrane protein 144-like isoform X1 [Acanthaster planci]|uniref:Transmembrane protein 144-like isoform X1 n=1 Tax=Acanthaster planci TaxID=133434 RepID=A0A8B7Z4C2_ACAPL|nr:transmembrane protein 144-like isoform X1 [Acanthaster planci]
MAAPMNSLTMLVSAVVILSCFPVISSGLNSNPRDAEVEADGNAFLLDDQDDFTWDNLSNNTNKNNTGVSSTAVGFIGAAVAVLFFGSNLVPIKKADTGDGMFYQWLDCIAIWHVGLIVHLIRGSPPFYPLAMLGGFLWTTGNVTVVPIIKTIGLSLGILIWGSLNLLMGWASGHFGLFGINKDKLQNPAFNYVGVSLAFLRIVTLLCIRPTVAAEQADESRQINDSPDESQALETTPLLADTRQKTDSANAAYAPANQPKDASWVDKLPPLQKRIVGIIMAIGAGCLYGFNFVPCIWIQDNVKGASQNGLDYVFAHFCGIILTSSVYFMVYCIYMRNRPQIGVGLIIPSVVSGAMWGIAQSGWFIANFNLSESVSFPIITTGPGIIASLWGVLLFGEIRGVRNLLVLFLAFAITITGAIFTALSK